MRGITLLRLGFITVCLASLIMGIVFALRKEDLGQFFAVVSGLAIAAFLSAMVGLWDD